MWRAVASNALTLFVVVLVLAAGVLAWGRQQYTGPGPLTAPICVRVAQGDNLAEVSRALEAQGAVSDARIFRIGAQYSGKASQLKFGSYLVESGASMGAVLDDLTEGGPSTCGREVNLRIGVTTAEVQLNELDPATNEFREVVAFDPAGEVPAEYAAVADEADLRFRVTLAEGATSWQVVDSLRKAPFLTGEIAAVPAEGSLAPNSYDVARGADRGELLALMADRQTAILAELWAARAADLPYDTPEEALVMASIVEKETGVAAERPRVAGVFVNRLRSGMRLQTDPTVIYGVTRGEGALGRGLRQSELRRETPYNTYVITGLPPTPIANPGRDAIEAAVNPAATEDLFFVADGTGGHAFAKTLEEHNENVARWRALEAQAEQDGVTGVQGE